MIHPFLSPVAINKQIHAILLFILVILIIYCQDQDRIVQMNDTQLSPQMLFKKRASFMKQQYFQEEQSKPNGNYILLINHYHQGQPLLTLGPNYIFFFLSFIIFNSLTIILLSHIQQYQELKPFYMIKIVSAIFLDVIWLSTALINPGIATKANDQDGAICGECQAQSKINVAKAMDRFHCKKCNICIDEYLFHSLLIGGCVGKNNYVIFKILLFAIFVESLCLITIIPLLSEQ